MESVSELVWAAIVFFLYFLPTFVARQKDHHNKVPIGLVNLLLGWTFIGWVVAMVWATTRSPGPATAQPAETKSGGKH